MAWINNRINMKSFFLTITSSKGHLKQTKKNVLSTKITPPMNNDLNEKKQTDKDTIKNSKKNK